MKKVGVLSAILFAVLSSFGQPTKDAYGKPLIVLTEQNPWLMVVGSDTPTFVLYENGHVIYKHIEGKTLTIYECKLDSDQLKNFITDLDLSDSLYELPSEIIASDWTDQPDNVLKLNFATPKVITVYGNLRLPAKNTDEKVPKALLSLVRKLFDYSGPSATIWNPQVMEVMFWDFSYAKETKPWPEGLPDLESAGTKKFNNGMYSVYLTADRFDVFKKFYASIGEKTAVDINGKKMALAARFPFPNIQ